MSMGGRLPELTRSALLMWQACDLKPDERVLVLGDTGSAPEVLDAFFAAAVALGARPNLLVSPARSRSYEELPDALVEMILANDIVVSLLSVGSGYSASAERIGRDKRTRMASQPGDALSIPTIIACPPNPTIVRRAQRVEALMTEARSIRVRSPFGTDLSVQLDPPDKARRRAIGGGCRAPGSGDAPFMGSVTVPFPEGGLEGLLVMRGGMRLQGPIAERHMVDQPTRIEVQSGAIRRIDTGTAYGARLQRFIDEAGYPEAAWSQDCNLGVDHRGRLSNLDNTAVHSAYGCIMLGFAFPVVRRGDGIARPGYHMDMTLTGCDIWLDDRQIIAAGRYTPESGVEAGED